MNSALLALREMVGSYQGEGINHENEKFRGTFSLVEILNGAGFQIQFEARSLLNSSIVFHSEFSTVATNAAGGVSLFNLNTNVPFLAEHVLVQETAKSNDKNFIFRFGDVSNPNSFREEIHLKMNSTSIRYDYHWGMPHGEFSFRSGVSMTRLGSR